jgi:EmrB/QacA subfamily drug resistance transporter
MTPFVTATGAAGRSTEPDRPIGPGPRLPLGTFAVTAVGVFMASLDLSLVNVAFPALKESFPKASDAGLAWVITAYTIVFAALLVTAGRIADQFGRRRAFYTGLAVFAVGSAAAGAAPSVNYLIAGRILQAVGAALLVPSSLGLLLAACPQEKRAQTVALWGGVGALAVAVGPSIGAALITAAGWRSAFYLNVPFAVAGWLMGRRVLPADVVPPRVGSPDIVGVLLLTACLAGLVLAISESSDWGWTSPRIVAAATASLVGGSVFVGRCRRHPQPVLNLSLFKSRLFTVANAATATYAMGFFALLLGSVLFLTGVWHYSVLEAGLAMTPAPLVVVVLAGPAGRTAARIGFRPLVTIGGAVLAGGLSWFAVALGPHPEYASVWLPGYLMMGIGVALTLPVLSAAAASGLPPAQFAVGSAVNQTCRQVGGALGIAVLVAILGQGQAGVGTFRHLWIYCAAMAACTGVISLLLPPRASAPTASPGRNLHASGRVPA